EIIPSHKGPHKVQDPYTLRCIPQVLGAVRSALSDAAAALRIEMNAATDNPLIFPEGMSVSGGNFHAQALAMALDHVALGLAVLAGFSERRIARLVDTRLSDLPPFLTKKSGLNSGMMIVQYVAAGYASDNKVLAHPASADSIPTSANQEDFVPMGMPAAPPDHSEAPWMDRKQTGHRPTREAHSSWKSRPQPQRVTLNPFLMSPLQIGQRVSRSATRRFAFSAPTSETSIWAIISCVYSLSSKTRWET